MKRTFLVLVSTIALVVCLYYAFRRSSAASGNDEDMLATRNEREEMEGTGAMEAMRWYNRQRVYPSGMIPVDWREKAFASIAKNNVQKSSAAATAMSWTAVGPDNIAGRARSIAIDPTNSNIIYSGSVSGGVWKSTDAGANWAPTNDAASSLVISCIAVDPTNSNIIYAGTGEGFFNIDALRGAGVLKSTDAGATWTLLTNFANPNAQFGYYYIHKIIVRPDNHNTLYAAMLGGVWKSTDAGTSWAKLNTNTQVSVRCTDLVADPTNADIMYAAFGFFSTDGIYKTTNGGTSWLLVNGGFPPRTDNYVRISLAIAPSNPQILYACICDSLYYTHSIQKTTNGGTSWSAVTKPMDPVSGGSHLGGQGWYNNVIAVHPTNPNIVFTGGINMYKSTDGGTSWTMKTNWYSAVGYKDMHADQHAILFDPANPSTMYFGNDGGMYKSVDVGENYSPINNHLATTQLYSGSVHPTSTVYLVGTQDNGTARSATIPNWSIVLGGDGGGTAIDYTTPTTMYTEYVYCAIQKSTNSGSTWVRSINGIPTSGGSSSNGTSDRCLFIGPLVMDPSNPAILVTGTFRLWRTTNSAGSWTSISSSQPNNGDLTGDGDGAGQVGSANSAISAIAIAKNSSATIYVGTSGSGTAAARVMVTTNTGTVWTNITQSPLPDRYVTSFAIDPTNASRTFAGYSGYNSGTPATPGHVFLTTNRGASWTNASGNLPDIPVSSLLIDPNNTSHVLAGTDLGVFETLNNGTTWTQRNTGLANVSVTDLDLRGDGYVFAATHGRGMYKSDAVLTGIEERTDEIPREISLHQNYPNPFNPNTTISFSLNTSTQARLVIYDVSGREVAVLIDDELHAGTYRATFDGSGVASGVYYYKLTTKEFSETKKMLLVK
jgi:hypothetical protein